MFEATLAQFAKVPGLLIAYTAAPGPLDTIPTRVPMSSPAFIGAQVRSMTPADLHRDGWGGRPVPAVRPVPPLVVTSPTIHHPSAVGFVPRTV